MTVQTFSIARLGSAAFLLLCGVVACGDGEPGTPLIIE